MRPLPTFHPQSTELLNNVDLARRFWQTSEDGLLLEDWKKFCRWLKLELRSLAPSLRDWSEPWIETDEEAVSVNIEPGTSWTHNGEHAVCLSFAVFPDSFDDYHHPNVCLWVSPDWPHYDAFSAYIPQYVPENFVTTDCDANAEPTCPFWRNLRLGSFQSGHAFDIEGFARAIGAAFETLATVRPLVDQFVIGRTEQPIVAPAGKALILDLEGFDEVVELGLILVAYNRQTADLAGTLDSYTGLRDPGASARWPPKITPEMVKGEKLDRAKIEDLIAQADVIVSHNNGFDRPKVKVLFETAESKQWLCSLNGIPWLTFGLDAANLEYLCERHNIRNRDAHRALPDAEALLHLLAQKRGAISYFSELLHSQEIPPIKAQSAFAGKRAK